MPSGLLPANPQSATEQELEPLRNKCRDSWVDYQARHDFRNLACAGEHFVLPRGCKKGLVTKKHCQACLSEFEASSSLLHLQPEKTEKLTHDSSCSLQYIRAALCFVHIRDEGMAA